MKRHSNGRRRAIGLLSVLVFFTTFLTQATVARADAATRVRQVRAATSPVIANAFGLFGGKVAKYGAQARWLGATRSVVAVSWPTVQPNAPTHSGTPVPSDYDFSSIDQQVRGLGAQGIEAELRLYTCAIAKDGADFWATIPEPNYVRGARTSGNCTTMPPKDPATLYWLAYNMMKHYANFPYPVRFIAVENEINDHTQWPGVTGALACSMASCPMFAAYVHVLQTVRAGAHDANPNAVVLDSGIGSRVFGYGYARMSYDAEVARLGFSRATLVKWATYLNNFLAYRRAAAPNNPTLYLDTTEPTTQLLTDFDAFVKAPFNPDAAQIVDTGDRAYYLYVHMYANASWLDAVQLHAYDQVDDFPTTLAYIRSQLRASDPAGRPLMCWECAVIVSMDGATPSRTVNYLPYVDAGLLVKRDTDALGEGASQVMHLPLVWSANPPVSKKAYALPLWCTSGTKYEPVMCPDDVVRPTAMGAAYYVLAHSLAVFTNPVRVTRFGPNVFGYEFTVPDGHLALLWTVGVASAVVNTTALGPVTGITTVFGTAATASRFAFPLTPVPVYVHLA